MNKILELDLTPQLIKTFVENTPIAYIILDENRRIHYINQSFLKLRNLDREKTIGELCYNISNGGVPCPQCAVENSIISNKPCFIERSDKLPDGSTKYIDDYAIPLSELDDGLHKYTLEIMINRSVEMNLREKRCHDFDELISLFSELLESKDVYTANHSYNTATVAHHIAKAMNLDDKEVYEITMAARLHDIGKVGIPNSIINKPARLNDEEYEIIKTHPARSYDIIKDLESFTDIAEIVRHHHERIDGKGYPDGLKGDEFSLGAKIVAAADTFEAMTSDRPYRKALSYEVAIAEMKRVAGTQLDAEVVEVFEKMNFNYETYGTDFDKNHAEEKDESTVKRVIKAREGESNKGDWKPEQIQKLDKNKIVKSIFDNTPCGYVLMKPDHTVVYASDYFLNYMGYEKEDVIGKKCYTVNDENSSPCESCSVRAAIKSGNTYKLRREQRTKYGLKTFDMFGIPLKNQDDKIEYIIELTIDRTEEAKIEKARLKDYKTLFDILTNLVHIKGADSDSKEMVDKIPELQKKLKIMFDAIDK